MTHAHEAVRGEWRARLLSGLRWLALWTGIAAIFGVQSSLFLSASGEHVPWTAIALWAASEWYTWALLSPLIAAAARRWPVERGTWPRTLAVHLALSVVFGVTQAALQAWMKWAGIGGDLAPRSYATIFTALLAAKAQINPLTYWVIGAVVHLSAWRQRARDRERAAAHLEALLAQAQLQALRAQLSPHFLFNALNTISDLIDTDPRTATTMVARLGDFLRLTLRGSHDALTTLQAELELVDRYLDVERARFEDRLQVITDVDADVLRVQVPALILQPLVENAIRHGVARVEGPAIVTLAGHRRGDELHVEVRDNGPGWPAGGAVSGGVGLANTRARLERAFGRDAAIDVIDGHAGGAGVRLRIPWDRATAPAAGGFA